MNKTTNYKAKIGLEIHVELKTKSKMFCDCSTDYFGKDPNTYTCPVCLGLPGVLPVPNKTAIEWCVMLGLTLNCNIPLFSKFDRKNYFYPDLPKGYQISQYDQPFAINGSLKLKIKNEELKIIRIRRVHMEEDTGKLIHETINGENVSLIDFNRSGVPLVEIVTEPDFENATDVKKFLQKLQQIVRYIDISDADMEKGQMRLEPNISIAPHNYKVEVKNINSFSFVEKAINYELKRQIGLLNKKERPIQETRGWDEKHQKTVSQRIKEEASDYRYFPEPDIPPIRWTKSQISNLKSKIPELPDLKLKKFKTNYRLSDYDSELLTRTRQAANYFEEAVKVGKKYNITPKQIANYIINRKINIDEVLLAQLIQTIINQTRTSQVDEKVLDKVIEKVLSDNSKAVGDYKKGKQQAIMFLIGQITRELKVKVDIKLLKEKLEKKLRYG